MKKILVIGDQTDASTSLQAALEIEKATGETIEVVQANNLMEKQKELETSAFMDQILTFPRKMLGDFNPFAYHEIKTQQDRKPLTKQQKKKSANKKRQQKKSRKNNR